MKNGKRRGVRVLAIVLAVLIAAGGAGFGAVKLLRNRNGEVSVYPAGDFITGADFASNSQTDGIVSTDRIQSVYLSSTQVVTGVYVEEGQVVKEGDLILSFDTTLSELNLRKQAIRVDQLKLDLENTNTELRKIDTYRIGTNSGSAGDISYVPEITVPTPTPEPALITAPNMPFNRTQGSLGTFGDPIILLWNDECVFSADLISQVVSQAMANRTAYLNGGEPVGPDVPVTPVVPTESPETTETPAPTDTPEPTATPDATDAHTPTPGSTQGPTPTPEPTEEPTPTPEPTEEPTPTPEPTEEPTPTPEPTEEPEPDPEPEPVEGGEGEDLSLRPAGGTPARKLIAAGSRRMAPAADTPAADPTETPAETPAETERPQRDIDPEVLAQINDPRVYVVFEVRDSDAVNGTVLRVWEMVMNVEKDTGIWSFRMISPVYDPGDETGRTGASSRRRTGTPSTISILTTPYTTPPPRSPG